MGLLTKNIKPIADYQQWRPGDYSDGDILGVEESLGGRAANSVTLESPDGNSSVKFNVSRKIYGEYNTTTSGLSWVGLGQGVAHVRPVLIDEIQENKPEIHVEAGETQTWNSSEVTVRDIEIVISSGLKVTVT